MLQAWPIVPTPGKLLPIGHLEFWRLCVRTVGTLPSFPIRPKCTSSIVNRVANRLKLWTRDRLHVIADGLQKRGEPLRVSPVSVQHMGARGALRERLR